MPRCPSGGGGTGFPWTTWRRFSSQQPCMPDLLTTHAGAFVSSLRFTSARGLACSVSNPTSDLMIMCPADSDSSVFSDLRNLNVLYSPIFLCLGSPRYSWIFHKIAYNHVLLLPYGFSFYIDSELYLNVLFGRIGNHYFLRLFPIFILLD